MSDLAFGFATVARRRIDVVLLVIVVAALGCRLTLASNLGYIHDEENNAIPLAKTISLTPGALNLPLRGENHGALPAYVVKASGAIFGETPRGYRSLHVLLGVLTVVLVYRLAFDWYGVVAARWASAIIAFNDYFLPISSRATAHAPFLFLIALSLFAFSRFLKSSRPSSLYAAGAAAGMAFYCKEHSALLVPVFFLTLLHPSLRHWLRRPHTWFAVGLFALFLAPDLYWNATTPEETLVTYGDQPALQARYANHLRRVGGVGFSPYTFVFYGRSAVMPLYRIVTGRELYDETAEYASINPLLGALLLVGACMALVRPRPRPTGTVFLLLLFWGVFLFFTFIAKGDPPGRLSPISWMWVETTMFPAAVLTGAALSQRHRLRIALPVVTAAALVWSLIVSFGILSTQ